MLFKQVGKWNSTEAELDGAFQVESYRARVLNIFQVTDSLAYEETGTPDKYTAVNIIWSSLHVPL